MPQEYRFDVGPTLFFLTVFALIVIIGLWGIDRQYERLHERKLKVIQLCAEIYGVISVDQTSCKGDKAADRRSQ